jgi:hypothetical protein
MVLTCYRPELTSLGFRLAKVNNSNNSNNNNSNDNNQKALTGVLGVKEGFVAHFPP